MSEINQNNWNHDPNQVWSFQNMKYLFSTQILSKSNDPSLFNTKLNQDIDNFEFDTLEGKSISIKDSFSETHADAFLVIKNCLLYTSPSPRDVRSSRMPSSA